MNNAWERLKELTVRHRIKLILLILVGWWYVKTLPQSLFNSPSAHVLFDREGTLLGAGIAADGQWRFSPGDSIPERFKTCLLQFEDRRFYLHFGISVPAMARALVQNLKAGKVVSGGSTITMQVIRMSRKNPPRTFSEKLYELILATRLEFRLSKNEILSLYATHAPFGNNVVGLEAACWRYFGKAPHQLSWAEHATLAVLPNAPGLIYPGKRAEALQAKRNRLLKQLNKEGYFDDAALLLAMAEPLPEKPKPLPALAPHVLDKIKTLYPKGATVYAHLHAPLQTQVEQVLLQHQDKLKANGIYASAVIVADVNTGKILCYWGNTPKSENIEGADVDCASANRSPGSILKPLLFAQALSQGMITPDALLLDVPSYFGAFSPKNFHRQFEGALPAKEALAKSLNVPFVRLLNEYGLNTFYQDCKNQGFTLPQPASYYGLSIILGGQEVKLIEVANMYLQWAQKVKSKKLKPLSLANEALIPTKQIQYTPSVGALYYTFKAMEGLTRPDEEGQWQQFEARQSIAWKTGTSYGFRDAWAVGLTADYLVAVWVGNASGEGRPGLTGARAAAPILFDVFRKLPVKNNAFPTPVQEVKLLKKCKESGYAASANCPHHEAVWWPMQAENSKPCPYHQRVQLDQLSGLRVAGHCANIQEAIQKSWFVLPPAIEKYYRIKHPDYQLLPQWHPKCQNHEQNMVMVYPRNGQSVKLPPKGALIAELALRYHQQKVYWHLNEQYLGETSDIHQLTINAPPGKHTLTAINELGELAEAHFTISP